MCVFEPSQLRSAHDSLASRRENLHTTAQVEDLQRQLQYAKAEFEEVVQVLRGRAFLRQSLCSAC